MSHDGLQTAQLIKLRDLITGQNRLDAGRQPFVESRHLPFFVDGRKQAVPANIAGLSFEVLMNRRELLLLGARQIQLAPEPLDAGARDGIGRRRRLRNQDGRRLVRQQWRPVDRDAAEDQHRHRDETTLLHLSAPFLLWSLPGTQAMDGHMIGTEP